MVINHLKGRRLPFVFMFLFIPSPLNDCVIFLSIFHVYDLA